MVNEVAVLIGTGSIGLAIARLTVSGRTLVLADYNEPQLHSTAELLRNEGYKVITQLTDVSDKDAIAALAKNAASLGSVTRVIQAAGVSPNQAPPERIVQVDLLGTIYVLDAFAEIVGKGGSGIVVASQAGHMGGQLSPDLEHALAYGTPSEVSQLSEVQNVASSMAAYVLAKRANALRVRGAAVTWGKRGARVNCISPGIICKPLARDEMSGPHAKLYQHMLDESAVGRMGTPSECGQLAAFLMDERGAFITGTDILNDGGVVAGIKAGVIES
jgi:NAD(P)-dependent dehydrogenase (short-subunit alcohol dehydrogenase family)